MGRVRIFELFTFPPYPQDDLGELLADLQGISYLGNFKVSSSQRRENLNKEKALICQGSQSTIINSFI